MISLQIDDDLPGPPDPALSELLERAALETLDRAGGPAAPALSIVINGDAHLQTLNRQYLGIDAPTDVLSVPSNETDPDSGDIYLGDILISYPRAQAQAQSGGHPLQDELQLLAVHGVLHLLGYDHDQEDDKSQMWSLQAQILKSLGCSISAPASTGD